MMASGAFKRRMVCSALAMALVTVGALQPAAADQIQFSIDRGRVTLIATDAPLADILAAWAQTGDTRFVGADTLVDQPLTLHLVDVDEADVMRLLLRSAAGYVAAPRRTPMPGTSRYDRVKILGGSVPQTVAAASEWQSSPLVPARARATTGQALPAADLQRLVDAVAGPRARAAPPEAAVAAPRGAMRPAPSAPLPGMTVEPEDP